MRARAVAILVGARMTVNATPVLPGEFALSYPVTSGRLVVRQRREGVLVYDRAKKKSLRANTDFAEFLSKCDGTRTVTDIVTRVAHERSEDPVDVGIEIRKSLIGLRHDGIVTLATERCHRPITISSQKSIYPLNTVYVEPTRQCNLKCVHCYAGSPTFSRCPHSDLSTAKWQEIIDEVAESGVMNICFTGGEPFVRSDICKLLLHADKRGLETAVFTNAVALAPSDIDVLAEVRPKFIAVGIDSHVEQAYQRVRGSNLWSKAVGNIERMLSRNLHPRINCVLLKGINDSASDIEDFLRFARELGLGADDVTFDEFCPEGEGATLQVFCVNELTVMDRIARAFGVVFGIEYRQRPTEEDEEHEPWSFCGIGTDMCYITHEAKVALCPALTAEAFFGGDMNKSSLLRIWDQGEVFGFFREREYLVGTRCQSCEVLPTCKAGCRAKALTFNGTMASHDPWMCAYFAEGYRLAEQEDGHGR